MAGVIAHQEAERLRTLLEAALGAPGDAQPAVPDSARAALFRVVEVLESSGGAVIFPSDMLMTTHQAAEALGVSRMTIVRLVDRGELSTEGGGVHRRIAATEVARYRATSSTRRRAAIRELAEELGEDTEPDEVITTR